MDGHSLIVLVLLIGGAIIGWVAEVIWIARIGGVRLDPVNDRWSGTSFAAEGPRGSAPFPSKSSRML